MTSKLKLLVATSAVSAMVLGSNPAFAAGTASGTDILNNVTVNYQVGGVAQTAETDSDTFKVDRKINLTVAATDTATTNVSPGESGAVTTFTVTNTSNATLDFSLSADQGPAFNGGTDNFDVTGLLIFVEDGTTPGYQPGEDTATFIDELAADGSETVYILGDVPIAQNTGDISGVILTATAGESGTGGTEGAAVTETAGANTAGAVDTVFADVDGPGAEGNRDGAHSAGDDYTVVAADITVVKTSRVVSDPFNGTTNPKAIPGATIEYCIAISNGAGSADATSIAISDTVPANLTFDAVFGVVTNGITGGPVCDLGADSGAFAGGIVSGTIPTISAGQTRNLVFRVTVD